MPDRPHLDNSYAPSERIGPINAPSRYAYGLMHAGSHLGQLREILGQAYAARKTGDGTALQE